MFISFSHPSSTFIFYLKISWNIPLINLIKQNRTKIESICFVTKTMSPCLSKPNSHLSAVTFFAKSHPSDVCGVNGLPLIPNSIAIYGSGQILKTIRHPNLCEYLDIVRGKHGPLRCLYPPLKVFCSFYGFAERIVIVSEHLGRSLSECGDGFMYDETNLRKIFYQIAQALDHLSQNSIVCHNLEPANVLVDSDINVKLFNYGLFHMTNAGEYVSFPIG